MINLYAWRRPAFFGKNKWLDHTFATSYSTLSKHITIDDVKVAEANYWYCWGAFCCKNGQPLPNQSLVPEFPRSGIDADLNKVKCICNSNDEDAHGTIIDYLADGVCHQLTNQVLYYGEPRITVKGVNGWKLSFLRYGVYGKRYTEWEAAKQRCGKGVKIMGDELTNKVNSLHRDCHEEGLSDKKILWKERCLIIRELLGSEFPEDKIQQIIAELERADDECMKLFIQVEEGVLVGEEYADKVNKIHAKQLENIARFLTPEEFKDLLDILPGETLNLADPEIAATAFRIPKPV